jgi:hypothetical protein
MRRRGLALRVTRRHCLGRDALPNHSFCHARVVYFVGQERRATATGTLGGKRCWGVTWRISDGVHRPDIADEAFANQSG